MSEIQAAKEAIQQLFQLMEIQHIICVDDAYSNRDPIEEVIGLCVKVEEDKLCEILGIDSIDLDDEEIWKRKVRKRWDSLSENDKRQMFERLSGEANEEGVNDTKNASILDELLEGHRYQSCSFHEWKDLKSQIAEFDQDKKMLLLFDEDFSGEGESTTAGIGLILEAVRSNYSDRVICGLLSGKYSPEEEYEAWERITNDHEIPQEKFVLLSKQRLAQDATGFARMIKLTVLNPNCKTLTEKISGIVDAAHQTAKDKIKQLNIYNYEHIVFQSSQFEGVWEPDTLFRLFRLFHKKEARSAARSSTEIRELATKIRQVSSVATGLLDELESTSWRIQRQELYDLAEDINPYHLPIESGDIFGKTTGNTKYILLAQPCDLVVRRDGKRHQSITEVILAKIVDKDKALGKSKDVNESKNRDDPTVTEKYYELRYFNENTGVNHYVDFRDSCAVKLCVLDLCVYQSDGIARFAIGDCCPTDIIPTWNAHYNKVIGNLTKEIELYCKIKQQQSQRELPAEIKQVLKASLELAIPKSSNENLFKAAINVQTKTIKFGVERVGRLCQPYAGALLTKFAQYSARAAFEHDFGKIR